MLGLPSKIYIGALLFVLLCNVLVESTNQQKVETDDNEFAEFEDFDDEETVKTDNDKSTKTKENVVTSEAKEEDQDEFQSLNEADTEEDGEVTVEEDDDHLRDDEEFEGYDPETPSKTSKKEGVQPDLKITKIPMHLRTNWESFHCEMLMLAGLVVYFVNFIIGKTKNNKLADVWFKKHKDYLEKNFTLVGDNVENKEAKSVGMSKESEHQYSLWCSGRACCEGMLVQLKLLKRQDLVNIISRLFRPACDQIMVKVTMDEAEMESFVMCVATKKTCSKLQKEMNDLNQFCPEIKKSPDKYGLPNSYQLLSEIGDATSSILDRTITEVFRKYEGQIEFIHFSDQYSGPKTQDEDVPKKPVTEKVLLFCFNVGTKGNANVQDMENMFGLMQLVMYSIDKVHRTKLSREAKAKADKNRQKVDTVYSKMTHSQRQETAQLRREEKQRAEKERMMKEEDPDRQRKLEDSINKKESKKKGPKMKMMKVKSM